MWMPYSSAMDDAEQILSGGNVAARVVRVGDTVRKPGTAATPTVGAFLNFLRAEGFEGAPAYYGVDDQGRQVLQYLPGVAGTSELRLSLDELAAVGRLIRRFHDCSEGYVVPGGALWDRVMTPDREELVCHYDLAPWNLVRDGDRWTFIDWDGAAPGSRMWDLAYAAITFPPVEPEGDASTIALRIAALVKGYGLDDAESARLPGLMRRRAIAMRDLLVDGGRTGREPWARLYREGHADYWDGAAAFILRWLA